MEDIYQSQLSKAKQEFYRRKIKFLKNAKSKPWHRELKKLTSFGQNYEEKIEVEDIKGHSGKKQAELIADKFAEVSQQYERLKTDDVDVPQFSENYIPIFTEEDVIEVLSGLDTNKSNVQGEVPARIFKHFASQLGKPVASL